VDGQLKPFIIFKQFFRKEIMRYSGIQPQYFPRLHYFARMLNADLFMIRDEAQFVSKHKYPDGSVDKSFQAHTPVKSSAGMYLLSVPIKHNGRQAIFQTEPFYSTAFPQDHLKNIHLVYGKSLNFKRFFPELVSLHSRKYENLAEMNIATILWGLWRIIKPGEEFPINLTISEMNKLLKENAMFRLKELRRATESKSYKLFDNLTANEKILALCQEVGATEDYCGGTSVNAYFDHSLFEEHGIKAVVQNWPCKEYTQLFPKHGFLRNLSIIDLLMNTSEVEAREILGARRDEAN
jgi:hypothetical protein